MVVFYGLTLVFTFLIGGLQQEAELLPDLTFLPQWEPGIAGLITMLILRKKYGVHITFFSLRMPLRRYLWAFLLPFLFALVFLGGPQSMQLTFTGVAMMIAGALGEEIGWRGYLHKRIGPHMMGLLSCLVVGILWMSFHVYYFEGGVAFMAFFGLGLVSLSVMAYAVQAEYEFNMPGATLFHLVINLTSALYVGLILNLNLPLMVTYGVDALAAALVVFTRRNLFF